MLRANGENRIANADIPLLRHIMPCSMALDHRGCFACILPPVAWTILREYPKVCVKAIIITLTAVKQKGFDDRYPFW